MKKIKLLHLISRLDIGGAEKQLLSLVSHLDKGKYDICVGYFEGKGELKEGFREVGIKTKKFKFIGLWDISLWWRLYQDMKINGYDIVHTHGFKADLWGGFVAKLVGVPIIISSLHNQEWYLRNPFTRWLERLFAFYIFDRIIAVSESVKRFAYEVGGIPKEKIKKVYYGINLSDIKVDKNKDFKQELGIGKDAPLIGCIGRLVKQKGHKYLIRAAKRVIETFPQAKFLIVGKGKLDKKLKKLVKRQDLDSSVIFTGFREDIHSIIDRLDLLVHPSLWEGFGLVLLEAMAMGKPIVATNVGGIPEVVKNKETGILVSAKDSKVLAKVIIHLLKDRSLAARLGEMGKLTFKERFQADKMAEEIERIYNRGD